MTSKSFQIEVQKVLFYLLVFVIKQLKEFDFTTSFTATSIVSQLLNKSGS